MGMVTEMVIVATASIFFCKPFYAMKRTLTKGRPDSDSRLVYRPPPDKNTYMRKIKCRRELSIIQVSFKILLKSGNRRT